jgi:hypothetical protein
MLHLIFVFWQSWLKEDDTGIDFGANPILGLPTGGKN